MDRVEKYSTGNRLGWLLAAVVLIAYSGARLMMNVYRCPGDLEIA